MSDYTPMVQPSTPELEMSCPVRSSPYVLISQGRPLICTHIYSRHFVDPAARGGGGIAPWPPWVRHCPYPISHSLLTGRTLIKNDICTAACKMSSKDELPSKPIHHYHHRHKTYLTWISYLWSRSISCCLLQSEMNGALLYYVCITT